MLRRLAAILPALLSLSCAGCLRVDGIILPGGGALLRLDYPLRHSTLEVERLKFDSPDIEILAAEVHSQQRKKGRRRGGSVLAANFRLRAHDLGALSDAYMFRFVTVTKLEKNGLSGLSIKIQNDKDPRRDLKGVRFLLSLTKQEPVVIRLRFPGRVVSSDADSTDRNTATWRFACAAFFGDPEVTMTAWYRDPSQRSLGREGSDGTAPGSHQGPAS